MRQLPPEREEGPVEYKLKLLDSSYEKVEKLASQMKYRILEGGGEALYIIGVRDNGIPEGLSEEEYERTLNTLKQAANLIGAKIHVVRKSYGKKGIVAEILVRFSREDKPPVIVSVAALGNVDAGKSTLIGVLCTGELDNGRGLAMKRVARYLHELQSGRTSSISDRLLGFTVDGQVVNYLLPSPLNESEIYMRASKIISLIDLGGHERYLKTTLRGVMSRHPDYVMLAVAANAGLLKMGREHLGICIVLRIPFFIVITKIDVTPQDVLTRTLREIQRILKMPGIDKIPFSVKTLDDVSLAVRHISSGRIVPIFQVSNVTGKGIKTLLTFLNLLPPRMSWNNSTRCGTLLYIEEIFNVRGVGPVVAGLLLRGMIRVDDKLYLGPFKDGSWRIVKVKSIHVNRIPVQHAVAGQYATYALAGVNYDELEKGQALLDLGQKPKSINMIKARITILKHPTTIKRGYQAVLHLNSIRSTVTFANLEKEPMRTGDTGIVDLKFLYHPWYIEEGSIFILREARTRAIGKVLSTSHAGS